MPGKDNRVVAIRKYIDEHYDNVDLGCDFLAEHCGLSSRHLRRLFSEQYHMGVREYMMSIRLENAKRLLEETGLPVEKVILKVGYNSTRYFRKMFKAHVGCTMSEYRKANAKIVI